MKNLITILVILCSCIVSPAQDIQFSHENFATVSARAKKEKKLIFIDFYTVWCGPCRKMAAEVFKQPAVAELYNSKFVNYKLDAERGEGIALAKKYEVAYYPSFVFIDADGNLYNKSVGYQKDSTFMALALQTQKEFETPDNLVLLKAAYPKRKNDTAFLVKYINKLAAAEMSATIPIEQYLTIQTAMPVGSQAMMEFLTMHYRHLRMGGKAEAILRKYIDEFRKMAEGNKDQQLFLKDYESWLLDRSRGFAKEQKSEALMELYMTYWNKLPDNKSEKVSFTRESLWLDFYASVGNWVKYKKLADHYLDSLADYAATRQPVTFKDQTAHAIKLRVLASILVTNAEIYYKQFPGEKDLNKKGLRWVAAAIHVNNENAFIQSTYADFLYRNGQRDEAITWKQRGLKTLTKSYHRDLMETNLAHMQKGESLED
jgi:thiol-disulfide isomerase/thioredoxin